MMDKNISVLVIDDDIAICYLYQLVFEDFNISCSTVNSLEAAKIELETYIPTFVVLDNAFPEGKGIDFAEYLNINFPCIKIIMCAGDFQLPQSEGKKIYQVIEKPFTIEKIKIVIDSLIKIPRCTKEEKCFAQECSRLDYVI